MLNNLTVFYYQFFLHYYLLNFIILYYSFSKYFRDTNLPPWLITVYLELVFYHLMNNMKTFQQSNSIYLTIMTFLLLDLLTLSIYLLHFSWIFVFLPFFLSVFQSKYFPLVSYSLLIICSANSDLLQNLSVGKLMYFTVLEFIFDFLKHTFFVSGASLHVFPLSS